RDAERAREPAEAVGANPFVDADDGLARAHEHRVPLPFAEADDVEAVVHAVDQIDVRVPRRSIERLRALRDPDARVAREILRAAVRLGLDDAHGADSSAVALLRRVVARIVRP